MDNVNNSPFNIKLTASERIIIFLPLVIVIIVVSFFFSFEQTGQDDLVNIVIPANYSGVIVYKYLDDWNHGAPVIDLKTKNGIEKFSAFNWKNLYQLSERGDSLYKKPGERTLKLMKKEDKKVISLTYFAGSGFGCAKRKY